MVNGFKLKEGDIVIRKKLPHNYLSNEWWSSRGGDFTSLYKVIEIIPCGIALQRLQDDHIIKYAGSNLESWNKVEIKIDKIW